MAKRDEDLRTRLEERSIRDEKTNCWIWTGAKTATGYGRIAWKAYPRKTHRISYIEFVGPLNGLMVLHTCSNKLCWNPAHLYLGNHRDNIKDAYRNGERGKLKKK